MSKFEMYMDMVADAAEEEEVRAILAEAEEVDEIELPDNEWYILEAEAQKKIEELEEEVEAERYYWNAKEDEAVEAFHYVH